MPDFCAVGQAIAVGIALAGVGSQAHLVRKSGEPNLNGCSKPGAIFGCVRIVPS